MNFYRTNIQDKNEFSHISTEGTRFFKMSPLAAPGYNDVGVFYRGGL
jgi:hypothetical protein